ncbi:MAG: hypothetical protein F6K16_11045 [Symploca sp. SIO2B6]|nr:hypothetical protein [Symploca sp. SIO2B6]
MGRWGDGEMGRWGDGEMGRWGDECIKKSSHASHSFLSLFLPPYFPIYNYWLNDRKCNLEAPQLTSKAHTSNQ